MSRINFLTHFGPIQKPVICFAQMTGFLYELHHWAQIFLGKLGYKLLHLSNRSMKYTQGKHYVRTRDTHTYVTILEGEMLVFWEILNTYYMVSSTTLNQIPPSKNMLKENKQ